MTERPLAGKDIWGLERYFNNNREDTQALSLLVNLLAHHNDMRSILLRVRAESRISQIAKHSSESYRNVQTKQVETHEYWLVTEEIESKKKT
ncbi:MAG: hypothetical protein HQ553_09430 [Chloroflexi bacterium]|nr:hypothetical protein [Chloroflexota bacterium]